jgi:hypothetical protein
MRSWKFKDHQMIIRVFDTRDKLHMLKQAPQRSMRQVPHSQRMKKMLKINHLHKAKKISKEQSKEDIKKPYLHLKKDGHQRKGMKVFFIVNVIHVMNMVTKLWNADLMQGKIMEYFITP